jgi:hypothetical protein
LRASSTELRNPVRASTSKRRRLLLIALVVVLSVGGIQAFSSPSRGSAASAAKVLILDTTVTGGSASIEATEAASKGMGVDVVDAATWSAMTTAQFASYQAIILGDPTCAGPGTATVAAAESNAKAWGAALSGNVVILGTDPVFHATYGSPGGAVLTQRGIDFAIDQPGKTGAYIALSCYYHGTTPNTPVPLLDAINPGGFQVTGVGCYNTAHIVAASPALAGLTDGDLSNWSCSVHEAFDKWPGNFIPLAIAKDFDSSFTASDGTTGPPYILASGNILSFPLSLSPLTASGTAGTTHTVTAQLLDSTTTNPVAGARLGFLVTGGPNVGVKGACSSGSVCLTDSAGHVSWTYRSNGAAGDDTIETFVDLNGNGIPDVGEPQTSAGMSWSVPPRTVMFVHGINGDWNKVSEGQDWAKLTVPIRNAGITPQIFEYYQDVGDNGSTGCHTRTPDTLTGGLYLDPRSVNPAICDSKSALAIDAAVLDDDLRSLTAPATVIANSLGGAITRGWLDLAQQRRSTASPVDSVIFLQGAQQGSWLAGAGVQLDSTMPGWLKGPLEQLASDHGFNVNRPGIKDVAPVSKWYNSVNPVSLPHLHYYNFITDLQVTFQFNFLFWSYSTGPFHYGDLVMTPGSDTASAEPVDGGAGFLPYGLAKDQHEYVTQHGFLADGVLGRLTLPGALLGDSANHINFGNNLDTLTVPACNGSQPSISIAGEVVRILSNPAAAC